MSHCFRTTPRKARFEIRNSIYDRSSSDAGSKRRSELSGSVYGDTTRLPNGVELWGAAQFIHYPWADPDGMAQLNGGVHGQVHIGNSLGGPPAVAFRRTKRGEFAITTRGEFDLRGTLRWRGKLAFGKVHDLVFSMVLHETRGALSVWLNGVQVVGIKGQSIGTHHGESYWNIGCYYGGGVTCRVIAEFGNNVYPDVAMLSSRISNPPHWF